MATGINSTFIFSPQIVAVGNSGRLLAALIASTIFTTVNPPAGHSVGSFFSNNTAFARVVSIMLSTIWVAPGILSNSSGLSLSNAAATAGDALL